MLTALYRAHYVLLLLLLYYYSCALPYFSCIITCSLSLSISLSLSPSSLSSFHPTSPPFQDSSFILPSLCRSHFFSSSLLLSLLTISLLTLLCPFFFFFPFIPPLFSLQPTALPHKKPNSPGITKQTLNPINISNRQPLRGLLSAIDASLDNQFESSCLVFRVKGIRNAL